MLILEVCTNSSLITQSMPYLTLLHWTTPQQTHCADNGVKEQIVQHLMPLVSYIIQRTVQCVHRNPQDLGLGWHRRRDTVGRHFELCGIFFPLNTIVT